MGRHYLKHPLMPVSPLVHCDATPALNFASQLPLCRRPLDSLPPALLIMAGRQRRPPPAHCLQTEETELDSKTTQHTAQQDIAHTRLPPKIVSTEHKNRTQKTNYTRVFFNTRPIQRTRILNANRKWEITRRMETLTVVTKIYGLSVRLTGM